MTQLHNVLSTRQSLTSFPSRAARILLTFPLFTLSFHFTYHAVSKMHSLRSFDKRYTKYYRRRAAAGRGVFFFYLRLRYSLIIAHEALVFDYILQGRVYLFQLAQNGVTLA